MTAKEEAVRLYELFYYQIPAFLSEISKHNQSKTFAMFVTDELLKIADVGKVTVGRKGLSDFEFWTEVKTEIEKL